MTEKDLDKLWNQALRDSVRHNEPFTRYRFAELVIDLCARVVDEIESKDLAKDAGVPPLVLAAKVLRSMKQ